MYLLDGKSLQPGVAFTYGDIQYPANWLTHSTLEERTALGITEIVPQQMPDGRFYVVTDNNDGTYNSTPRDLVRLKKQWTTQYKLTANNLLHETDWMVTRKYERNIDIPQTVADYRAAIITEMNRLESAIDEASDIEQFISVVQSTNWPTPLRDE
jgi:hypothetical protein